MTLPRLTVPGTIYKVTRRVFQRQLLLKPGPLVDRVVLFCFAAAAERYGIELYALVVMSNHYHVVFKDVHGNMPAFFQWVNRHIAVVLNEFYQRRESFWKPGSYSAVAVHFADEIETLNTREDVLEALDYVELNPVRAGLVHRHTDWPGIITTPRHTLSHSKIVERPTLYFSRKGKRLPKKVEFRISKPDLFDDVTEEELAEMQLQRLREKEEAIQAELVAQGRRFVGSKAVLATNPFDYPSSHEARVRLNPRVCGKNIRVRISRIQRVVRFSKR